MAAPQLRQFDTVSWRWGSKVQTLEQADPQTAALVRHLEVKHTPPGILRGIERFNGLRMLEIFMDGPLDLGPLACDLPELEALELRLRGPVTGEADLTGEAVLAGFPHLGALAMRGSAEHLRQAVDTLDWASVGAIDQVYLEAVGNPFVLDITPLGALRGTTGLVTERIVLGPRELDAAAFAALLPPGLELLCSAHADRGDRDRIDDAFAILHPEIAAGQPSEAWFECEQRVRLDPDAPDPPEPEDWNRDPQDGAWVLVVDLVPVVGRDGDDGAANHSVDRLVRRQLRDEHPDLARRVRFDTTAEELFLVVCGDEADRDVVDTTVRAVVGRLRAGATRR